MGASPETDTASYRADDRNTKAREEKYGCLAFKPSCMQCFNTIKWNVVWQCVFAFLEGFVVNGVINVVLVALEKRYKLPSSKSGIIASSNDFGAITCVVLVGYFGERRHKPRLIATGALIMSVGCLIFSLPHFAGELYQYAVSGTDNQNSASDNTCTLNKTDVCEQTSTGKYATENNDVYFALLMIGNGLLGVGASPLFTIGLSYIDENCKSKLSSLYLSWTFCSAAVGVAIGYIVGGQSLSLFVDVNKIEQSSVPLTSKDPQWIGAWWIGPLVGLTGFLLVAVPIYGFPKRLPGYTELQKSKKSDAHGGENELTIQANFGKGWRDFPKSILLLLRNPTYVCLAFGATFESLIVGGMATFGAKLIQEKFNIDLSLAGTIMGIITIPGSGGGMLLGGYVVKRFKLRCRGMVRLCAVFMVIALCCGPFWLSRCTSDPMVGLDRPYMTESSNAGLVSDCNSDCGCTTNGYEPVCVQGVVYFSACYAGCRDPTVKDNVKAYHNCTCLTNWTKNPDTEDSNGTLYELQSGVCSGQCPWLWAFSAMFLVVMILTFSTFTPTITAIFRCVPTAQRSVAIGVNSLFVRLVGTTPGPILLGAIIDSSCMIWQDTCGVQGSCWVYDKQAMGLRIMLWFMGLKLGGVFFYLLASFVYKPPPPTLADEDKTIPDQSVFSITAKNDSLEDQQCTKL